MFDLLSFLNKAVEVATQSLAIVMPLVTWYGEKLGISGKVQFVSSLVTGLAVGGLFGYLQFAPVDFVSWVQVVLTGLISGLMASGVYNVGKAIAKKL